MLKEYSPRVWITVFACHRYTVENRKRTINATYSFVALLQSFFFPCRSDKISSSIGVGNDKNYFLINFTSVNTSVSFCWLSCISIVCVLIISLRFLIVTLISVFTFMLSWAILMNLLVISIIYKSFFLSSYTKYITANITIHMKGQYSLRVGNIRVSSIAVYHN